MIIRRIRHIGITLLVLLFTGYFTGTNLYYHLHVYEGKVEVHSHPYHSGSASTPDHTHTQSDCLAIQLISGQPVLFASAQLFLTVRTNVLLTLFAVRPTTNVIQDSFYHYHRRGPPAHFL